MPRLYSTPWTVGDAITASRMNQINSDIDNIYSTGSDRLKVYAATGLDVNIGAGTYRVGSSE